MKFVPAAEVRGAHFRVTNVKWRRVGAVALAAATSVVLGALPAPAVFATPADAAVVSIDVVTINDFHGRIEADGRSAGAAVVAGAVQQFRGQNPNTIFAGAGDLIGASTFTSFIQDDNPTIDALNAAGLDVSATGNHEFDQGWDDLNNRVQPRADWEYIASNVFLSDTGEYALAPSWVTEFEGVKVGFVGAVVEGLKGMVNPDRVAELEVRGITESVNTAARALNDGDDSNGEADVVILLVHEGASGTQLEAITPDSRLGEIVSGVTPDVDAIVSAHTHLAYNHVIDGRPVVSSGQYGENLGLMKLKVDASSKELISITNEIKPLMNEGVPLYAEVPEVTAIVSAAAAAAEELGSRNIGKITADFNRAVQSDGKAENRGGESTIGNFTADVLAWSAGADLALINPGALRANLMFAGNGTTDSDGDVSYREAAMVQPFANSIQTVDLTGAQLKQVFEEQWQPAGSSRSFLKLGVSKGVQVTYDPTAAQGSHVTLITVDGTPIDQAASYTVAANAFLAEGGDQFDTMGLGANRTDTGRTDLQSMVDWFANFTVATPDLAQRSVGAAVSAPAGAGFVAGEDITVELSSLAFSAGEPTPPRATISLAGSTLATAQIDPAIVDTTDESGRATLSFEAPAGVSGPQNLLVTVAGNDTRAIVPITFSAAASGQLSLGLESVKAGDSVVVSGSSFAPGSAIVLELRSTPVSLGGVASDDTGAFTQEVRIPVTTHAGAHEIVAIMPDGSEVTAALTVTSGSGSGDSDAGETSAGAADGGGSSVQRPDDSLAATGSATGPKGTTVFGASVALMAVGLLTFMLARARRGRSSE